MSNGDDKAFPEIRSKEVMYGHPPSDDLPPVMGVYSQGGLSKREYFAGQAMFAHLWMNRHAKPQSHLAQAIAKDAVACADALLNELSKEAE